MSTIPRMYENVMQCNAEFRVKDEKLTSRGEEKFSLHDLTFILFI